MARHQRDMKGEEGGRVRVTVREGGAGSWGTLCRLIAKDDSTYHRCKFSGMPASERFQLNEERIARKTHHLGSAQKALLGV